MLIPCLRALFAEFDVIAPRRRHASDGSVGDLAHQQETSDHNPDETGKVPIHDADKINEVHAIDVDADLNTPGLTMEMCVQRILERCRAGKERRLRYIIFNRRTWDYRNAWREETYRGSSDPHTGHAHFSASYDSDHEADVGPWGLEDLIMTDDDLERIVDKVLAAPVQVGSETWKLGSAIGYAARKAYEIDKQLPAPTLDQIRQAIRDAIPPAAG